MYNFNTSLSTPPMLGVGLDFCSSTPRTPEILNSLIAMTNPFEYSYSSVTSQASAIPTTSSLSIDASPVIACKMENFLQQFDNNSQSNCSSVSSTESPSATPLHMTSSISSTPSLQQTRSQLIKAGVKLLIQNKRKNSGSSSCDADYRPPPLKIRASSVSSPTSNRAISIPTEVPSALTSPTESISPMCHRNFSIKTDSTTSCDEDSEPKFSANKQLTPEDEDRRRRRRERNKIAATKCRLKKRECINNLMRESETLEAQNVDLKSQMKDLEDQYHYLTEMWRAHQLECKNPGVNGTREQNNNSSLCEGNQNSHTIKDTNNNKQLNQELPSLTPLINCNVSFDFY